MRFFSVSFTWSAAALAIALSTSPAAAQDVATVDVSGREPTSLTLNIAGLEAPAVRRAVRGASYRVCRNAVSNHELDAFDAEWCSSRTREQAMLAFRAMRASSAQSLAAKGTVMVALNAPR